MSLVAHLKTLSHHAYGIIASDSTEQKLRDILLKIHGIKIQGNPDFFEEHYEILTIDDARNLKSLAETRPIGPTGKRVFIISMNGITTEAQNALLKLLEEPSEYAHFFLVIPSAHLLLPTVKSRLQFIGRSTGPTIVNEEVAQEAKMFLKNSPAKRLDQIKKLIDDISKEKRNRTGVIEFLSAVEDEIYSKGELASHKKIFESIETARTYIHDRAPSVKMLLEYVALNL